MKNEDKQFVRKEISLLSNLDEISGFVSDSYSRVDSYTADLLVSTETGNIKYGKLYYKKPYCWRWEEYLFTGGLDNVWIVNEKEETWFFPRRLEVEKYEVIRQKKETEIPLGISGEISQEKNSFIGIDIVNGEEAYMVQGPYQGEPGASFATRAYYSCRTGFLVCLATVRQPDNFISSRTLFSNIKTNTFINQEICTIELPDDVKIVKTGKRYR